MDIICFMVFYTFIGFFLIWTLFEPVIIKSIIIETAANQGAIFNDKNEANLIYEKIKAIYLELILEI